MKYRNALLALLLACLLIFTSCTSAGTTTTPTTEPGQTQAQTQESTHSADEQARFDAFALELFTNELSSDPIGCHYLLTEPEAYGINPLEVTFSPFTLESLSEGDEALSQYRSSLDSFDLAQLDEESQLAARILDWWLSTQELSLSMDFYYEPLSPYTGLQSQLPVLLAEYAFRRAEDVEIYLNLLEQLPAYLESILLFEENKAMAGLFMSETALDQVLDGIDSFVADTEDNLLITTFEERLLTVGDYTRGERDALLEQNATLVQESVLPAFQALGDGLETLREHAGPVVGLGSTAQGLAYYEYLVRSDTGSDLSLPEMLELAEDQLESEMGTLMALMIAKPDLSEKLATVEFSFSITDPEEIIADLKERIQADYPALAETSHTIKYVPASLQEYMSPAFYLVTPIDAPDSNVIYINQAEGETLTDLYPTMAHEGYPGHLYQTVYFSRHCQIPLRHLLSFTGYSEGWATYVEYEMYAQAPCNDPDLAMIYCLDSSLSLAISALTDLRVNALGQSLEEVTEFLNTYLAISPEGAANVYNYVASEPGNYLRYYIGFLEFTRLRSQCEETLGDDFVLKEFHQVILETGDAPFLILEEELNRWCEKKSAGSN